MKQDMKDVIDEIHADEIITRSWTVCMKYYSNESWSKSASQNWELEHSTQGTVLEETDCGHERQETD